MSESYGPPDPYAGFRDQPLPLKALVCLPPTAPRTQAEALQATFDSTVMWFIAVGVTVLLMHVFGARLARSANDIMDALAVSVADIRRHRRN